MAIHLLERLSNEDLAIWRGAVADKELVDANFPGLSISEARNMQLKYFKTLGDLLESYKIDLNQENIVVSAVTGCIISIDEG